METLREALNLVGATGSVWADTDLRQWRVAIEISGPDARYAPANSVLGGSKAVDAFVLSLEQARSDLDRLAGIPLPAPYSKDIRLEDPRVTVHSASGKQWVEIQAASPTNMLLSIRLDKRATSEWLSELGRARALGPKLEDAINAMSPSVLVVNPVASSAEAGTWRNFSAELFPTASALLAAPGSKGREAYLGAQTYLWKATELTLIYPDGWADYIRLDEAILATRMYVPVSSELAGRSRRVTFARQAQVEASQVVGGLTFLEEPRRDS